MSAVLSLTIGTVCAAIGGELFVRGTVALARAARLSPALVGATVTAFATSSPELSVSVMSALSGAPHVGLGDALGSNIVNAALILGLAALASGVQSSRESVLRDLPVAMIAPIVTAALAIDSTISRMDGLLMLSLFGAWLTAVIVEAGKQRAAGGGSAATHENPSIALPGATGLVLLLAAGYFIVSGARALAERCGGAEFAIGATVVAIGTSAPELATTLVATLRGHGAVALGTILGSNIINGLLIVPSATVVLPIAVRFEDIAPALSIGTAAVVLAIPPRSGRLSRRRGLALLGLYVGHVVAAVRLGASSPP